MNKWLKWRDLAGEPADFIPVQMTPQLREQAGASGSRACVTERQQLELLAAITLKLNEWPKATDHCLKAAGPLSTRVTLKVVVPNAVGGRSWMACFSAVRVIPLSPSPA